MPCRQLKPLLAVDVDGVFALDDPAGVPAQRVSVNAWGRWRREISVPVVAAEIVRSLRDDFDIVWATSWGHNAHTALRQVLDLPGSPWPFLPVQFNKAPVVDRYARGRPWALIEELIDDLSGLPVPASGVVLRVRPDHGIADVDPRRLRERVQALGQVAQGSLAPSA